MSDELRLEVRRDLVRKIQRGHPSNHLQASCVEWCAFDHDFGHHVTIQTNEPVDEHQQIEVCQRFGALVNSFALGKRWQRWPASERAFFVGVVEEGATDNRHVHLLLRMPAKYTQRFLQQTACEPWKRSEQARWLSDFFTAQGRAKFVCPHGDIKFRPLRDEADQLLAADYVFKKFGPGSNLILSSQFDPSR